MLMATAHLSLSIIMGAGVLIGVSPACTSAAMAMSVAARVVSERVRSSVLGIVSAAGSLGALLSAPMGRCSKRILAGASACSALWHALPIVPAAWYAGRIDRIPLPKPSAEQLGNVGGRGGGEGVFKRRACSDDLCLFHRGMQLVFITTHLPSYLQI
jgi:MFS family permease